MTGRRHQAVAQNKRQRLQKIFKPLLCVCLAGLFAARAWAQVEDAGTDLDEMGLEALLQQRASLYSESATGSGLSEARRNAPGALLIVDRQTIARRGYDSLDDVVADLPGFDTVVTNGTMQVVTYQRGYRTPWTQRTLLLVNGKVDNNLWNHSAQFSRQYPMTAIERIEVLYGPAGSVYGPNAFLGVINIITRSPDKLADGETDTEIQLQLASYKSRAVDLSTLGRRGDFRYHLAARWFESDEAPLEDYSTWGFTKEALLADPSIWGVGIGAGIDPASGQFSPIGDFNVNGRIDSEEQYRGGIQGRYADASLNAGIFAEFAYRGFSGGVLWWKTDEGYGPYYSFADGQPNASWIHESGQVYLDHRYQASSGLELENSFVYRESRVGGDWSEAFAGSVSLSEWNSFNQALRYEPSFRYRWNDKVLLSGGLKFEHKELTKAYVICNYWDGTGFCPAQAANSSNGLSSDGSGVVAVSDISSASPLSRFPGLDSRAIPDINIAHINDRGAYLQAIADWGRWRVNGGLRWDDNSVYGSEVSPRVALIFDWTARTQIKWVYGEAFQEPSPKDLFGAFNGRSANADLDPEKARNIEMILTWQGRLALHDFSLFRADYEDAIAGGENVGARKIQGFEYRGSYRFDNHLFDAAPVTADLYYSYTDSKSEFQYDNVLGLWHREWDEQGDIAPHKLNLFVNVPVTDRWTFNLRGKWVAERELFSRNPLRADSNTDRSFNTRAESYSLVDAALSYSFRRYRLTFKVENLFEESFLQSGVESASSGDNFAVDGDGFQNSLLPQVAERRYGLTLSVQF